MNEEFKQRFEAVGRIYGSQSQEALLNKHIFIIGLGGVGSWATEAIIRSGFHKITLIDMDDICISNTNRQIHTDTKTYGKLKTETLKERCLLINPHGDINIINSFYSENTQDKILEQNPDYIIDCIDSVKSKCHLISQAKSKEIPIIVTGGVGGKKNPHKIQFADLNRSYNDKLLMQVRKKLKREFGFPPFEKRKFHVPCLFSPEEQIHPENLENIKGLNCQNGFGSLVHVTGTMGFMAASHVCNYFLESRDSK